VFRAHDPKSGRLVALKVFELDLSPEQAASLAVELSHLVEHGLTHSAIAAPVGAGLQGSTPYLASEYVAAEPLDIAAKRHRSAAADDVPWIIRRIAEAIDYGAGEGVEHGLLHPRDVLVTDSDARVTGLGVGRALERAGIRLPVRRPYTAPERVEGALWTHASDVYALGVLAYELLTGRPFPGQVVDLPVPPEELPGIDIQAVNAVLTRALATQPDKRHRTARALVRDLDAALAGTAGKGASLPLLEPVPLASAAASPAGPVPPPVPMPENPVDVGRLSLDSEEEPPIRKLEDVGATSVGPEGMFGTRGDSSVPAIKKGRGVLAVAVILAAMAVVGYLAVVWSGWRTPDQPTGTPWTETTIPPPASQAPAAVAPVESGDSKVVLPKPDPAESATAPVTVAPARRQPTKGVKGSEAAATKPVPVARPGRMLIRSTPAGAQVAVNGAASGVTPLALRNLPFGSYTIRLTHPGYVPSDRQVTLSADQQVQSVEVELMRGEVPAASRGASAPASPASLGSLFVDSRPAGATVYFNDQRMGETPLVLVDLQAGSGRVRLERDGYRPWSSTIQVRVGTRARVAASLERAATR
jgi:serine/threonine-protein kinase